MTVATVGAPAGAGLRVRLVALSLGQIVSWGILYYGLITAGSRISQETGWPLALVTGLFSISLVVSAVLGILVGQWLDRRGPRLIMTVGSVVGVAGLVLVATAASPAWFAAGWVVVGIAQAAVLYQAAFTVLTRWYGERRQSALTVVTLAGGLASTVFAPLTAGLLSVMDWHGAFLVLAGILAVVTIPIHWFALKTPWPPVTARQNDTHYTVSTVLRTRRFWFLELATLAIIVPSYIVTLAAIPLYTERGMTFELAALGLGLLGAGQVVGRLVFVVLPRGVRPWVPFTVVGVLTAVSLGLMGFVPGPPWLLIGCGMLAGAVRGAITLVNASAVADRWGTGNYGAINGVYAAPITLIDAFAPALAPLLAAAVGGFATGSILLAVVALIGAAIAIAS